MLPRCTSYSLFCLPAPHPLNGPGLGMQYYEAVGPLPSRLQPPMWRSPQSKKRTRDSFEDNEDDDWNAAAIEEHKQKISRHRQHWARAATPPGYWNIGFPDTQEVEQMNAEATRMHQQKQALVAQEAQ